MTFTTTTNIFAPFNYLTNLKLVVDVEMAIAGQNNHIANAIRLSLKEEPVTVTLAMIKDMAEDNHNKMADILGLNLVKRISNGV